MMYDEAVVDALMAANAAKDLTAKVRAFSTVRPKDLAPRPPALADLSSGLTMGDAAEKMARENGISREAQDAYTLGFAPEGGGGVGEGRLRRRGDAASRFRPGTRPPSPGRHPPGRHQPGEAGGAEAGVRPPLRDRDRRQQLAAHRRGGRRHRRRGVRSPSELGLEPLAAIRSWGFAALDPSWQMLMGPAFATPVALDRAGITMERHRRGRHARGIRRPGAVEPGGVRLARVGEDGISAVTGHRGDRHPTGSTSTAGLISLGHPFAATGARQALTMANELARRGLGSGVGHPVRRRGPRRRPGAGALSRDRHGPQP